ncbi:DUF2298 domain-containing protein [Dictyobacter formicarum]|uniref:Chlor_Arch_YYY domain protein n=1 Tax=Dictyobacter formicarum TaxID=2778368 RepID=A0ABQ3VKD8_9CHLR|nr:DUF2298 domain-containing protein [Dictyobacter formicarum]GHO86377.1 hypothetical protein KSZ_43830 [Dictyobacter formicarum]
MFELLQMWALVEVLGIIFLPLTVTVFHNIPDRGWAWSKALAVFVTSFCVWWPLMVIQALPFSRIFILAVVLVLLALNIVGFLRTRQTILHIVRSNGLYIVATEAVFLVMVFLLGWLRSFGPDIHSFEMFMDEGFLASIMRSQHFPPPDMWYAGYAINYYYYAHFIVGFLAKLLGQIPSVAFNTGISMLYGLTAVSLFGVTSNVISWSHHLRRQRQQVVQEVQGKPPHATPGALKIGIPFGLITVIMALMLGNIASAFQWFHDRGSATGYDWFNPTRIIPRTINEFPAFSFLLSDFHAHVLSLAFTIMAIGMAFNLLLEQEGKGIFLFGRGWRLLLTLGATALSLGGLFVMNGWDLPTYMGLAIVCIGLQQWLLNKRRWSWKLVIDIAAASLILVVLALLLFLPFHLTFISPSQGIGIASLQERTSLRNELLIYTLLAFVFLSLLFSDIITRTFRPAASPTPEDAISSKADEVSAAATDQQEGYLSWPFIGTMTGLGFIIIGLACQFINPPNVTLFITLGITITAIVAILQKIDDRAHAFALLLGAVAFALIAGCEIFFLRDVFVDNNPRMNSVFKFYFQAWILLSIACGAGFYYILENFQVKERIQSSLRYVMVGGKILWSAILLVLVLASSIYPIVAPYYRFVRFDPVTRQTGVFRTNSLDGLNYLQNDPASAGDYNAIRWLNANISGSPVIVEAVGDDYTGYARISALTGLPTIMGWVGHEYQWRVQWFNRSDANAADFNSRKDEVSQIYSDPNPKNVLTIMARYHAQYIYVGALERSTYSSANLARFASFMQIVYHTQDVTIYKVKS